MALIGINAFSSVILPQLARYWRRGVEGCCLGGAEVCVGRPCGVMHSPAGKAVMVKIPLQVEVANIIKSESVRNMKRAYV